MKLLTFAVPCYNSADYMDHCIQSLLDVGSSDEVEILIVDDGSTKDNTAEKADEWQDAHPDIIRAIHQPNGGHGAAVNTGLANASGLYYKVVDSDDWLDRAAAVDMLDHLRELSVGPEPVDMFICNYVYEHVLDGTHRSIGYSHILPRKKVFTWEDIGHFPPSQNLLMHSVIYRTQLLRDCHLQLPEHTFYVDNIFVYVPLPHVERLYYLDVDLYRYFIGREDQSVNESVMVGRIEQQLTVTRAMIDQVHFPEDVHSVKLTNYMVNYMNMMMTICTVFSLLSDRQDRLQLRDEIWLYLRDKNPYLYRRVRRSFLGLAMNLRGEPGRKVEIAGYRAAQRLFKFN